MNEDALKFNQIKIKPQFYISDSQNRSGIADESNQLSNRSSHNEY